MQDSNIVFDAMCRTHQDEQRNSSHNETVFTVQEIILLFWKHLGGARYIVFFLASPLAGPVSFARKGGVTRPSNMENVTYEERMKD